VLDDLYQLRERARQAAGRGDHAAAAALLVAAAGNTHVGEADYVAVLRPLGDVLAKLGDARGALTVEWYLGRSPGNDRAAREVRATARARATALLPRVPAVDRARTLAADGDAAAMERAAQEMEEAGLVAHAAVYREKAEDWRGARALWSRLASSLAEVAAVDGAPAAYNAALVHLNLARCSRKVSDKAQAREATVAAVRLIEEAADQFEAVGRRESAFDCFQVLVQIGRESKTFEDVLEGYVNCIRILREDHLRFFALQYFDEALRTARDAEELSAAATLSREAAEYARAAGLAPQSAYYTMLQAELWHDVAEQQQARGAPVEIAENAYLAAILAYGDVGQFGRVGSRYQELAAMDLEPARKAHYSRAAARYRGVKDEALEATPLPAQYRQESQFPEVWHVDLLEWEQRGSAAEACAEVLLDTRWLDLVRRRALLARLTAFTVEAGVDDAPQAVAARVRLAEQLAALQIYSVLSPLEAMWKRPELPVRLAVLSAMKTLHFKRSFLTLRDALSGSEPQVLEQASRAVEALWFNHAFDPLARIVRESPHPQVRASALRALARVETLEAAEFLLGVLEHGAPQDRESALFALRRARSARFIELARQHVSNAPEVQALLRELGASRA